MLFSVICFATSTNGSNVTIYETVDHKRYIIKFLYQCYGEAMIELPRLGVKSPCVYAALNLPWFYDIKDVPGNKNCEMKKHEYMVVSLLKTVWGCSIYCATISLCCCMMLCFHCQFLEPPSWVGWLKLRSWTIQYGQLWWTFRRGVFGEKNISRKALLSCLPNQTQPGVHRHGSKKEWFELCGFSFLC